MTLAKALARLQHVGQRLLGDVDHSIYGIDAVYEQSSLTTDITTGIITRVTSSIACKARRMALTVGDLTFLAQQGAIERMVKWGIRADVLRQASGARLIPQRGDFLVAESRRYRVLLMQQDMAQIEWLLVGEEI